MSFVVLNKRTRVMSGTYDGVASSHRRLHKLQLHGCLGGRTLSRGWW